MRTKANFRLALTIYKSMLHDTLHKPYQEVIFKLILEKKLI